MKIELDFFTTTFHNFGRDKTTKWKSDKTGRVANLMKEKRALKLLENLNYL